MYPPNQGGMRTPDRGSTTGAASWTDDEPARRLPEGRAQRVNPPLTAIFKKELVRMYGFFFALPPVDYRMMAQFTSALSAYREHNAIRLTISRHKKTGR
ncbi:hypothetical protein D5O19_00720 [Salmonella enterica subsp. enterica serovar Hessarek]|nr:hypothetical protein [Salmonella enterica subsp. enterica serovar Hessarek]